MYQPHAPTLTSSAGTDFHLALLWLRALEIRSGHTPDLMVSELDMDDLFSRYRSPFKA